KSEVKGIPVGSGLGISSILSLAVLKALYAITGREVTNEELLMRTIHLESRMGALGGWQDPIGGLWGGIKWIEAKPGNPIPTHQELPIPAKTLEELQSRMVLVYSGQ